VYGWAVLKQKKKRGCKLVSTGPKEDPFAGCAENSQEPWGSSKRHEIS
jgi:hypothetical protein